MVRRGQRLDMDAEKRRLEAAGYRNVGQVLDPGDFAVRGALLDIYAMGADEPYRIELFDDEVERSEEHTSELQSLMRISYAVFCLTNKKYDSIRSHQIKEKNNYKTDLKQYNHER